MQWLEHPVFIATVVCVVIQLLAWNKQRLTDNADTVDMAWAAGIVLCAVVYLFVVESAWQNTAVVCLFPIMWYCRLLYHLVSRYDVNHEDSRYQNLRAHWAENTQIRFLGFFMFQAGLSVIFSLTSFWTVSVAPLSIMQIIAALMLGGISFIGVSIADQQLLTFKRNNDKTKVCNVGLWRYSRHPNYFFEWLHWFVYPIVLWGSDYFWWSWLIVTVMLLFLLKFTGIPFSEQQALKKRGQAYQDYMNQTSPFIPWRPKND